MTATRANGALVIDRGALPGSAAPDILKALAPAAGEPVLPPLGPDKVVSSGLKTILRERSIKRVIAMGTQAHTSVLHSAGKTALRGFKVVSPCRATMPSPCSTPPGISPKRPASPRK